MPTTMNRRRLLLAAGAAAGPAALLGAPAAAWAEAYPSKPIRFVNPFAPGGSADVMSRLFATKLGQITGGTLFVDNVGGAGGTIGSDKVAKSAPDGYTLLLSNVASQAIAAGLYSRLPYDPVKDFEHIALFGQFPNVLVVGPGVKANSYAEFIAEAKARAASNPMTFGSAGNGSTPHLSAELLKLRTGIQAQHVPFKGAGPALLAVIGGDISFQFENLSTAIPQIRGGKLRALGVTSAKRIPTLPGVPTIEELGVPDFVIGSWYGISAPAKTPKEAVEVMAKATSAALADPAMQAQMAEVGIEASTLKPAQYRAFIESEIKRWGALIKASGAKVD
jgi:tripartite-type tricarboxylate transporter receptor subunit TctC